MPLPLLHKLTARTPGVSINQPPCTSGTNSTAVVVCRPRPSPSRISAVRCALRPTKALTNVLLPTPEAPSRAIVELPTAYSASSAMPSPLIPLAVNTSTAGATDRSEATDSAGSSTRSLLVNTTTGRAPLSHAKTNSRSSRRWFGGDVNA